MRTMAEGVGVEPTSPFGKPRLSKPVQYRSASLPRDGAGGRIRTSKLHGLNVPDMPVLLRPRGGESRDRTCDVYRVGHRFTGGCLRLWAYLSKWCARQDSNLHCPAPQAGDSANWPTSASGPRRIRTYTSRVLSTLPLPIGLVARLQLWRREGGSNSQEVFHSAVFGTAGLASPDRSLRKITVSDCDTAAASWNLAMSAIGTLGTV